MTKLHLSSLSIKQFRSFRDLTIPRLGQVNLITGKNAVGKTNLLEALRLYAESGSPRVLRQIFTERDEFYRLQNQGDGSQQVSDASDMIEAIRNLYFDRPELFAQPVQFEIGPIGKSSASLSIMPSLLTEEVGEDRVRRYRRFDQLDLFDPIQTFEEEPIFVDRVPGLAIDAGAYGELILPIVRLLRNILPDYRLLAPRFPVTYVPTNGLSNRQIKDYWRKTTLTDLDQLVQDALNVISPTPIQRINVISDENSRQAATVLVRTSASRQPLPLRGMGEGLVRAFALALALVNTQGGMLLIDEIDNGLHYSVQYEIWKLIFRVAHDLEIQVFATTHNWDSVAAFQQAAADHEAMEGMLIRLQMRGDDVSATLFDEHKLAIATREQIEVR